ncbi:S-layer homology domain-containing protein [Caldinitratiruptor microaerophilus]|uniref:SLH domain-containing protein n=1 Tax=Caldinitratiruptor microaerophilus TaxID=671077 RepID=A0AA35G723_9FIRM|nr:S-layer homology domain-containing protein [Caldinitratiruptor microaerophilus]BDG62176.1 hypothetical protein caldi_32660 [Caldinitratiruptor microaerophilus]
MRLKKLLVALSTAALVLGTVATASAATFPDVGGTKYADASARLAALNILAGFPDGTFRPNEPVTRAQMAAIAVRALGLESASQYAKMDTKFNDVSGAHWAAGYINVAVDQGLLKGYPDGSFKPENQVTYAEALAILVRALGYEPAVKGLWPTNYIVKASELGLSKGVVVAANAPATRGDIAIFTDNALDVDLLQQVAFGDSPRWEPQTGKTLLTENLGLTVKKSSSTTPYIVTSVPKVNLSGLYPNKITINGTETRALLETYNPDDLLGREIDYYYNSAGDIIAVKVKTDPANIITDTIDSTSTDGSNAANDAVVLSGNTSKTYNVSDANFKLYYNGVEKTSAPDKKTALDDAASENTKGPAKATVILDGNGKIRSIEIWQGDNSWIVTSVDTTNKKIEYQDRNATKAIQSVKDWNMRIVRNGKPATLGDIKPGDVLEVYGSGNYRYLVATDNKVTGRVTAITAATAGISDYKLRVDGKDYELSTKAYYSTDNGSTITQLDPNNVTDLLDVDATLYLNQFGQVRYVETGGTAVGTTTVKGVVLDLFSATTADGTTYYVRILKTDGTKVSYAFKDVDAYIDFVNGQNDTPTTLASLGTDSDDISKGDLVQLKLDSQGKVAGIDTDSKLLREAGDGTTGYTGGTAIDSNGINSDNKTIKVGGQTYYVTDSTVFIQNIRSNKFDPALTTWEALKGVSDPTTVKVALNDSNRVLKVVVITNGVTLATSAKSAMVVSRGLDADGTTLTLLIDGATTTYKVDSAVSAAVYSGQNSGTSSNSVSDVNTRDFVRVSFGSTGKITSITEPTVSSSVYVKSIDTAGGIITFNNQADLAGNTDTAYRYDDKTVFFDETGSAPAAITIGNLGAGDKVWAFDLNGDGVLEAVVKHDNSTP